MNEIKQPYLVYVMVDSQMGEESSGGRYVSHTIFWAKDPDGAFAQFIALHPEWCNAKKVADTEWHDYFPVHVLELPSRVLSWAEFNPMQVVTKQEELDLLERYRKEVLDDGVVTRN